MFKRRIEVLLSLLTLFVIPLYGFYLPGVAPNEYEEGEIVGIKVNTMDSVRTQVPYSYYDLPFCRPDKIVDERENLGEWLVGDKIETSLYNVKVKYRETCKIVCSKNYTQSQVKEFVEKIQQEYRIHWIVDNLPAATKKQYGDGSKTTPVYEPGFPLGGMTHRLQDNKEIPTLNNHVSITILYHENPDYYDGIRIVGFEVDAKSVAHASTNPDESNTCPPPDDAFPLLLDPSNKSPTQVTWTYDVEWVQSAIPWASRWDTYLMMTDDQIHWFSIINSVMIVLFLTGMVAMIMMRTLHRDIGRYRESENSDDVQDETGWKLVHGDVFRPPHFPMLLAVSVGSGSQTFAMAVVTMVFAVLGFLSPANRGGLMMAMVVLLVLMSTFAGYFMARTYKMFKGKLWKKATFMTAFLYPGIAFMIFFILNMVIAGKRSHGYVPWYILLELLALWFGIGVPLTFCGAYFGFKKPVEDPPVRVNQIPRQIPEQVWYMKPIFAIMMGGILPFGAIFIELFFILSSIWQHQFYYLFGFLFVVFVILIITCAEITIVMCYFQLCSEDYHWWWRAYLTSAASAVYMFIYSIFYFFTKLQITTFAAGLLYFGYTFIMTMQFFILAGTIGFYACYLFVHKIYSSIKVD